MKLHSNIELKHVKCIWKSKVWLESKKKHLSLTNWTFSERIIRKLHRLRHFSHNGGHCTQSLLFSDANPKNKTGASEVSPAAKGAAHLSNHPLTPGGVQDVSGVVWYTFGFTGTTYQKGKHQFLWSYWSWAVTNSIDTDTPTHNNITFTSFIHDLNIAQNNRKWVIHVKI